MTCAHLKTLLVGLMFFGATSASAADAATDSIRQSVEIALAQHGLSEDIRAAEAFWYKTDESGATWVRVRYQPVMHASGELRKTTAMCNRIRAIDPWECEFEYSIVAEP